MPTTEPPSSRLAPATFAFSAGQLDNFDLTSMNFTADDDDDDGGDDDNGALAVMRAFRK